MSFMQNVTLVLAVALVILASSSAAIGFIPWLTDDNALLLHDIEGTLTCLDGTIYDNLTFKDAVIFNEKDIGAGNPYMVILNAGTVNAAVGYLTEGEVVGDTFQIEGFITESVCTSFVPYAFELEGICNESADSEILYDISGTGVNIILTNVATACTDITD